MFELGTAAKNGRGMRMLSQKAKVNVKEVFFFFVATGLLLARNSSCIIETFVLSRMARLERCSRFYSNGLVAKWHRTSLSALHWHSPASHCSGRARLIVAADHRGVHASRATRACLRERGRGIAMRCDCRQWSSRARTLGFMGLRNGMNSSKDKHKG